MRILMAEDEAAPAKAVGRIPERNSYSVDIVHNGTDAMQYLAGGRKSSPVRNKTGPIYSTVCI